MPITFGSLFTGVGGLDLGFEYAGMICKWQVEIAKQQLRLLRTKWPHVPKFTDIRNFADWPLSPVTVIGGGDPCPVRSKAKGSSKSSSPDLSGYFLAVVARLRPRWVVRENVPASDHVHFDAALAALGYGTAIVRLDSAKITGQSRQRDFFVGHYQATRSSLVNLFSHTHDGSGTITPNLKTTQVIPALVTGRTTHHPGDCYIYEAGRLRILDGDEREAFAGFPPGWSAGFSETARALFYGNAIVPQAAQWIAQHIVKSEKERI